MRERSADIPVSADDVDAELKTTSVFSAFSSPAIRRRFERDFRPARIRNIRLAVFVGLPAYLSYCPLDASLLPDLGLWPSLFRLFAITPVGIFLAWRAPSFEARFREGFVAFAVTGTMAGTLAFIAFSRAPLAPYLTLGVLLVGIYANVTMRLRFAWACAYNGMTLVAIAAMILIRTDLPAGVDGVLLVSSIVSSLFGLVANHQLEQAEGRTFLLALKETLRSERLEGERQTLSLLSLLDPLTGIFNRRAFDARLTALCDLHRMTGREFSLLMIDVDHFKFFNDHYGHPDGDACLRAIADILRRLDLKHDDIIARLGGEEFAIVLNGDEKSGVAMAEQLRRRLDEAAIPHRGRRDGRSIVTVSIGIAAATGRAVDPIEMLRVADQRLYGAKRSGRDAICANDRVRAA